MEKLASLKSKRRASGFTPQHPLHHKSGAGFTIVELLIYISIVTVTLLVLMSFVADVTKSASRAKIVKQVQQNARLVMSDVAAQIRAADSIDDANSVFNNPPNPHGKLALVKGGVTTTLEWSSGNIIYYNGSQLSTSDVWVTELSFTKIGAVGNNGVMVTITAQPAASTTGANAPFTISSTAVPRSQVYN